MAVSQMNVIPCKAVRFFYSLCCEKHCIYPGENRKLNLYCSKPTDHGPDDVVREYFFFRRSGSRLQDVE